MGVTYRVSFLNIGVNYGDTHSGVGFPRGLVVKSPPAMRETRVQSLGQEDPLEEEMVTHSSIFAGGSHGQRSQAGCSS